MRNMQMLLVAHIMSLGAVAAAARPPDLTIDFSRLGAVAEARAGGVLNAFCNDQGHGPGHRTSRNVAESELTPLRLHTYRGCASYADEGVPQLLGRIGVARLQQPLSDGFGFDWLV